MQEKQALLDSMRKREGGRDDSDPSKVCVWTGVPQVERFNLCLGEITTFRSGFRCVNKWRPFLKLWKFQDLLRMGRRVQNAGKASTF